MTFHLSLRNRENKDGAAGPQNQIPWKSFPAPVAQLVSLPNMNCIQRTGCTAGPVDGSSPRLGSKTKVGSASS